MKFLLNVLLLLLLCQEISGQSDDDFRKIIQDCIRKKQDTGDVAYLDTALLFDSNIKKVLERNLIRGMTNDTTRDNIV